MASKDKKTGQSERPLASPQEGGAVVSSQNEVDAFLQTLQSSAPKAAAGGKVRIIFALDATMSRQATWDQAAIIQSDMFLEAGKMGALDVQLVYFRGYAECRASQWVNAPEKLAKLMRKIHCEGGTTQIERVLRHGLSEAEEKPVSAVIYIGDAMEESIDMLCAKAGALALQNVPLFIFQEGRDMLAERAFREMARLTKGAWCPFDQNSAHQLRHLLRAIIIYAQGGRKALADKSRTGHQGATQLLRHMKTDGR